MGYIDSFDIQIDQEATGENIKNLIKKSGYTIPQIRDMLHLESVQSIYRWRKGAIPSIDNLVCLALIFDVPMDEIVIRRNIAHPQKVALG